MRHPGSPGLQGREEPSPTIRAIVRLYFEDWGRTCLSPPPTPSFGQTICPGPSPQTPGPTRSFPLRPARGVPFPASPVDPARPLLVPMVPLLVAPGAIQPRSIFCRESSFHKVSPCPEACESGGGFNPCARPSNRLHPSPCQRFARTLSSALTPSALHSLPHLCANPRSSVLTPRSARTPISARTSAALLGTLQLCADRPARFWKGAQLTCLL